MTRVVVVVVVLGFLVSGLDEESGVLCGASSFVGPVRAVLVDAAQAQALGAAVLTLLLFEPVQVLLLLFLAFQSGGFQLLGCVYTVR
jgi:hypothetical protein